MIRLDAVTYGYPDRPVPALRDFSATIRPGEFILVVGPSGSGKSTLLRCINGLVPHFYGGNWSGRLEVFGRNPVAAAPRGMSDLVGFVVQDPEAQFVVDTVEDELAFAMENHAVPAAIMRKRVEEVLDQMGIAHLRYRRISGLSGGEKQRVAIAAVLALQPEVLVLDEPTSQLDPQAAEEVLVALRHLNEDLGLTVVLSEHRLERVAQYADRILYLPGLPAAPAFDTPRPVMSRIPLVPPLVDLGRRLGWEPLPLTIKEGRSFARVLAPALKEVPPAQPAPAEGQPPVIEVRGVGYAYGARPALRRANLTVRHGEFVALMGRNGSGKSTLLKLVVGLLQPQEGQVLATGMDTRTASLESIIRQVGYVPQNPGALLFNDTLMGELAFTRRGHGLAPDPDSDRALLARLGLGEAADRDPRDLSSGERQRAALASILVAEPQVILLDEPTRGLDYPQKHALARLLSDLQHEGRTVVMATHDVELAAACADRVALMAEGEVVVDGPAREVMSGSQVFASQINKLFRDPRFMTPDDVVAAVAAAAAAAAGEGGGAA
jgi:energy-coupling factor transport system ATP-binding protein